MGVSARAGEVAMRLGMRRGNDGVAGGTEDCPEETDSMAEGVAKACRGMGGTLRAVGQVIEACLSKEILKAKCENYLYSPHQRLIYMFR